MKTALLISTYNWPEALDLVLRTVQNQSVLPDEILIADDGSREETKNLVQEWKSRSKIPVKYFWQKDDGFRKTIIMNIAVAGTEADYVIQTDGDILLSRHFIKDHLSEAEEGFFLNGSRSLISENTTAGILQKGKYDLFKLQFQAKNKINATRSSFFSKYFQKNHFKSDNVKGCNFSFWRKDFLSVNGYNNEMNGWGHEDIELAARLNNLGIKQRRLKMKAVCFHLYHPFNDRGNENKNFETYREVVEKKITRCANGYEETV